MQAKTDHKRGFVWGLALAVTMTISSIWGQAVSSGQFVRAAQVEVTPVPAAQQTNIPHILHLAVIFHFFCLLYSIWIYLNNADSI